VYAKVRSPDLSRAPLTMHAVGRTEDKCRGCTRHFLSQPFALPFEKTWRQATGWMTGVRLRICVLATTCRPSPGLTQPLGNPYNAEIMNVWS
jgi:hypothetical protein